MVWYNPKYARPEQPQPPIEQGTTLALFARDRGAERLRVSLETFNGFPFLRLQAWRVNDRGEWWPTKGKCVTIKARELADLVAALRSAEDLIDRQACQEPHQEPRRDPPTASPGHRPSPRPDAPTGRVDDLTAGPDDHPRYVERRRRPEPRRFDPDDLPDPTRANRDFDELA